MKPSPAQLAQRANMRVAEAFHRQVVQDPKLLKKYRAIAEREGLTLSSVAMREMLRKER